MTGVYTQSSHLTMRLETDLLPPDPLTRLAGRAC